MANTSNRFYERKNRVFEQNKREKGERERDARKVGAMRCV